MHDNVWTNIDIAFVKLGILPKGRNIKACRVYFRRNGLKFPGKKLFNTNEMLFKKFEQKYNKEGIEMKESGNLKEIEVTKIRENPNNPRTRIDSVEDLKASIKASGLLCPIAVRWKDGYYEVVAGSRRYRACREIGLKTIPCNVLPQIGDDMAYELATAENIVRENMTAVDEANAVAKLFAQGKSRTEIGALFGKSARWAEGRRKIVELGEKAMEYLATGKINLGHAEVLTMCNPDDVEKWLSTATWKSPEDLKKAIMNEYPLLERAPFDVKKVCKNCEKRSDDQKDLFGDVQCCYCLDRECFKNNVKKKAEHWRKKFTKEGYEEVPSDQFYSAQSEWNGWIDASTEDEKKSEIVKKFIAEGKKPMFWVDDNTAEWGLVYRNKAEDDDFENDSEDNESQSVNANPDSWEYKLGQMSYDHRKEIKTEATLREKYVLVTKLKETFGSISNEAKALVLNMINSYYDDDGEEKSYLENTTQASIDFIDDIIDEISNDWTGVETEYRDFFGMESRESFERQALEAIGKETPEEEEDNV